MLRKRITIAPLVASLGLLMASLFSSAEAAEQGAAPVEGESFTKPLGTKVVLGDQYSGGKALKITSSQAVSTKQVTITETSKVLVRARAGQTGRSPTLTIRVDGANAGTRRITSSSLSDCLYRGITLQPGTYTIGLKGGDIASGRNVFVDLVTFPAVNVTSPEPVLDASNPDAFVPSFDMTAYDALYTTCSDCWWVQTFTAEHSGTIPYVYAPVAYATTGPIPVRLLEIAPDNTTTVLAETTVQWSGECSGVAACTTLKADFAKPPQVSAGSRYGMAVWAEGNLQIKETYGDPFTGGQSQLLEGGTFQRTWEGNIADLIFAVYVTPST